MMMKILKEKEHVNMSLQRDESDFCKNRTKQLVKYDRPKQIKMNILLVIAILQEFSIFI